MVDLKKGDVEGRWACPRWREQVWDVLCRCGRGHALGGAGIASGVPQHPERLREDLSEWVFAGASRCILAMKLPKGLPEIMTDGLAKCALTPEGVWDRLRCYFPLRALTPDGWCGVDRLAAWAGCRVPGGQPRPGVLMTQPDGKCGWVDRNDIALAVERLPALMGGGACDVWVGHMGGPGSRTCFLLMDGGAWMAMCAGIEPPFSPEATPIEAILKAQPNMPRPEGPVPW